MMNNLLNMPIPATADLFQVADLCSEFVIKLVESDDPAESLALCGRLSHALTALRQLCDEDLPPHLLESLTVDEPPAPCVPDCWVDSNVLVEYAQGLTQALLSRVLAGSVTVPLTGLLHDLVILLTEYLRQPHIRRESDHAVSSDTGRCTWKA
ncbi:hypothetical protein [Enterobacter sp. ENT03]|uniref:hypothetical protein n=1 Tax=Enterobacter sp. ENT03 TaxID=2854780 RepID=UPI001C48220B|nr:hypothetical protein [Enterobacter sp. ENT03]MBV7406880.1 hypothetical protein [Enterobacter sp. ENT03]